MRRPRQSRSALKNGSNSSGQGRAHGLGRSRRGAGRHLESLVPCFSSASYSGTTRFLWRLAAQPFLAAAFLKHVVQVVDVAVRILPSDFSLPSPHGSRMSMVQVQTELRGHVSHSPCYPLTQRRPSQRGTRCLWFFHFVLRSRVFSKDTNSNPAARASSLNHSSALLSTAKRTALLPRPEARRAAPRSSRIRAAGRQRKGLPARKRRRC